MSPSVLSPHRRLAVAAVTADTAGNTIATATVAVATVTADTVATAPVASVAANATVRYHDDERLNKLGRHIR